jgi:hypothetical protein
VLEENISWDYLTEREYKELSKLLPQECFRDAVNAGYYSMWKSPDLELSVWDYWTAARILYDSVHVADMDIIIRLLKEHKDIKSILTLHRLSR